MTGCFLFSVLNIIEFYDCMTMSFILIDNRVMDYHYEYEYQFGL